MRTDYGRQRFLHSSNLIHISIKKSAFLQFLWMLASYIQFTAVPSDMPRVQSQDLSSVMTQEPVYLKNCANHNGANLTNVYMTRSPSRFCLIASTLQKTTKSLPSLRQPQNNESTGPVSRTGDAPSHWTRTCHEEWDLRTSNPDIPADR